MNKNQLLSALAAAEGGDEAAFDRCALMMAVALLRRGDKDAPPLRKDEPTEPELKVSALHLLDLVSAQDRRLSPTLVFVFKALLLPRKNLRNSPRRPASRKAATVLEAAWWLENGARIPTKTLSDTVRVDRRAVDKWRSDEAYQAEVAAAVDRLRNGETLYLGDEPPLSECGIRLERHS